jgi:hypothetical protein
MNKLRNLLITGIVLCSVNFSYAQENNSVQWSKENMSRELITLRDSVSTTLAALNKDSESIASDSTQQYQKASHDLTRYKVQLDKTIDDVVKTKSWNSDIKNRVYRILSDVRREFKRIKEGF